MSFRHSSSPCDDTGRSCSGDPADWASCVEPGSVDVRHRPAHTGLQHPIVSSNNEPLILVDEQDRRVGQASKRDCHAGQGMLHRALSLLLFNDAGQLLLQQRAADKPLWPGFWSNSCCSHPRDGEDITEAAHRRAREELGLKVEIRFAYRFRYHARYLDIGSEHEMCSVFIGRTRGEVRANANEVADWRYVAPEALDLMIDAEPQRYTPWFRMEWAQVRSGYAELIAHR